MTATLVSLPAVTCKVDRAVAVIRFANPPVNGLSHAVRSGIAAALERASAEPSARAIVLTGAGALFSGGADIREFGTPASRSQPTLRDLIERLENSPKPVVAAIDGTCIGGGLELAMAAHYRVASADARLGLPEVKLGLLPGAGGTQRLPRLVGIERALEMIVGGEPVPARALADTALLDVVVEGQSLEAAIDLAATSVSNSPLPRARDILLDQSELARLSEAARAGLRATRHVLPAQIRAVDAIEAGGKSFDEGLATERRAFVELMEMPESKGLRHAFFAERAAGKVDGVTAETPVRPIRRAVVIGAGTMGAGIAVALLDAGIPLWLVESGQSALDRGLSSVAGIYDAQVKKGRLEPGERDRRLSLVTPLLDYESVVQADVAIEAVFESLDVKRDVFLALDRVMRPGAILATSTSTLDVDAIAGFTGRPEDVLGLHFLTPAHVMRLLEVVRGRATSPEALATALALAKRLRKTAVVSGVCDGFIGNRMLKAYIRQARYLVEDGAAPEQIDRAMEDFGFARGPFRVGDAAAELVAARTAELGIPPRSVEDAEIVDRLVYALVNEGARILDDGVVARASDIDVVYLAGYGFPRHRGGPMFYADQVGLERVLRRIEEFARIPSTDPAFWTPAPLLQRLAASGRRFGDL